MKQKRLPTWLLGICIGAILLIIGYMEEQFIDIFQKAVMICLECIGIG